MENSVYLREAVVFCAFGNTPVEIVRELHRGYSGVGVREFTFGSGSVRRDYHSMQKKRIVGNDEFYELLEELLATLIEASNLSSQELEECALLIGSTSMNIPCSEVLFRTNEGEAMLPCIGYGAIGEHLAEVFDIGGEISLYTTACTSSANALLHAQAGVSAGKFSRAIVLGFEFYNELTIAGFESFGLLSATGCRPFDRDRSGIVLGEGCGAILVDTVASDHDVQMLLRGGANRSDISSPTAHNTDGVMVAQTILDALSDAKACAQEVRLIKAHATGSENNDIAEGKGLKRVFASMPPVLAMKSSLGHTLGGCGVIELAALWFCIRDGFIPKTVGFNVIDDAIGLSPITEESETQEGIMVLNHFGFGGNGVVLVVEYRKSGRV